MGDQEPFSALPPQGPPPLLSGSQLLDLARQGWLEIALPDSLAAAIPCLFRDSDSFFANPTSVKKKSFPQKQKTEFGYYEVENEKEYVTFRCRTATSSGPEADVQVHESIARASAENLKSATANIWSEGGRMLHRILCDIARASELDIGVWDSILEDTLEMPSSEQEMSYTLMRVFHYLPAMGKADMHSDLGLLTLCIGDRRGLQVCDVVNSSENDLKWIDASEGTKTAIVLVGQTLKMLSDGALNAGVHRVAGNPEGRRSIVYALRHSSKNVIDLGRFGREGRIRPDELYKVMGVGRVNINAVRDTRDKQREALGYKGQG
ncbi:hypothetical protein LTR84_004776 [Exophiala bonariae]|uniref:Isopenicillin N synthase-like Fe(2+) 2OG dioxygenase domain-containing protein n=1 Tax=Exophiala bonariae TaxID=1690606 RepID=A0AAV9NQE1_9EURO|nr:hypothetical protein LTR84_004776 [Exophiala bonariae]